ncbi:uncharacterized protein NEMAJ01_1537 [Nematocida major]|uniref:uncharacterized protein n=1 Tax=Nematocida major TaxID=1912982 RepID=UPI002007551C|nr:uncharacterized protein NEMAJ01_1537 [Nematocida major]KAH9386641.1 hypothetical protein NEMAJ01_1537 [Nematocida major]
MSLGVRLSKKDALLGVAEGVDSVLAEGSVGEYRKGAVLGYYAPGECSYVGGDMPNSSVRKGIVNMQETDKAAHAVLFQTKDPMAW